MKEASSSRLALEPVKRHILPFALVLSVVCALFLSWNSLNNNAPRADGLEYTMMAYHLAHSGTISADYEDFETPSPGWRREPFYPFLMSLFLHLAPADELGLHGPACLMDRENPDICPVTRGLLKLPNIIFTVALTVLAGIVTLSLTGSRAWAAMLVLVMGVNTMILGYANIYYPEPIAAFLFLSYSYAAYLSFNATAGNRWVWSILSGLAFGCLVLLKAVFLYIALLLFCVYGLIFLVMALRGKNRAPSGLLLVSLLVAACVFLPWMARNHALGAGWKIAGRGEVIMSIRASYDTMPWSDIPVALAHFTPKYGLPLSREIFGEDAYNRLLRESENSYYKRAKAGTSAIHQKAEDEKISLMQASIETIKENFFKHLALTPVFIYYGAFVTTEGTGHFPAALVELNWLFSVIGFPAFLASLLLAWKHRQTQYIPLLIPALLYVGFHGFLTHFIPRYSTLLVPLYLILAAMLLHKWTARKQLNPDART